jgi:integrase
MTNDGIVEGRQPMKPLAKSARRGARPTLQNGTAPPPRRFNRDVRPREYLTPKEVERLIAATKKGGRRYGLRDATMILMAYRHGLRVSELCALTWDQIDFSHGLIHVRRLKNGVPSVHQLGGEEMRSLRALKRADGASRYVFMTERGATHDNGRFSKDAGVTRCRRQVPLSVHPHTLRHACGLKLANDGRDTRALQHYLGHKYIMQTVKYTELSPGRFKGFWED